MVKDWKYDYGVEDKACIAMLLWMVLTIDPDIEIDLDQFRINLNGNISGVNLSDIGVTIDGTSFNASSSVSATSLQDVSSNLAIAINANTSYSATLNGSFIIVEGQVINGVSLTSSNTSNVNVTVSSITKVSKTSWVVVPGYTGLEVLENVPAGIYRGIVRDGSGCGERLDLSSLSCIFEPEASVTVTLHLTFILLISLFLISGQVGSFR